MGFFGTLILFSFHNKIQIISNVVHVLLQFRVAVTIFILVLRKSISNLNEKPL